MRQSRSISPRRTFTNKDFFWKYLIDTKILVIVDTWAIFTLLTMYITYGPNIVYSSFATQSNLVD